MRKVAIWQMFLHIKTTEIAAVLQRGKIKVQIGSDAGTKPDVSFFFSLTIFLSDLKNLDFLL